MRPCVNPDRIKICWFLTTEGKTRVRGEKPLGAKERTNNNLNPNMVSTPRFEPERHNWWEGSASVTAAPALLPKFVEARHMKGDYPVDLAQTAQS